MQTQGGGGPKHRSQGQKAPHSPHCQAQAASAGLGGVALITVSRVNARNRSLRIESLLSRVYMHGGQWRSGGAPQPVRQEHWRPSQSQYHRQMAAPAGGAEAVTAPRVISRARARNNVFRKVTSRARE